VRQLPTTKKEAFFTLIDDNPEGSCTKRFKEVVQANLQKIAQGTCRVQYSRCVTTGWCKANLRELVESNLFDPASKAFFDSGVCGRSPAFQRLYQCADAQYPAQAGAKPWRWANNCAKPDLLTKPQCSNLIASIHPTIPGKTSVCKPPRDGWTLSAVQSYTCELPCAQSLATAWWQCQTSLTADFDSASQAYKDTLMTLVDRDPESPGPCTSTEDAFIRSNMRKVAEDAQCGPLYTKCYDVLSCRAHIRDGIRAMGYPASRVLHESSICSTPIEYQELHECSAALVASKLNIKRPFRRTRCVERDVLPPPFCRYLLGDLNTTCPSDGRAFTAQNAETYSCSNTCARSLVTAWHYCQTRFYMKAKSIAPEARAALRVLVRPTPPGPCTKTFAALAVARHAEIASDEVCGSLYNKCTASAWCMYNLRDVTISLADEHARNTYEDTMCDSDKSPEFQRLYACIRQGRVGNKGWKMSKCAEPDVMTPSQCAVLLSGLDGKSVHPSCNEPSGGWTLAAVKSNYVCSKECASTLTTAWLDCRTSFWHYIEDNTGGWSEQGRQILMSLVSQDPENPGPCAVTRYNMVKTSMSKLRTDKSCAPKFRACMLKFDCRMQLQDSIGRMLTEASRIQFEAGLCQKTHEMQALYECAGQIGVGPPGSTRFQWQQSRCWKKDKAPPSVCSQIMAVVGTRCPTIKTLTVDNARSYMCPAECGKTLITAWHYCETTFRAAVTKTMADVGRTPEAWYAVVDFDEDNPGPCAKTFRKVVMQEMVKIQQGSCKTQFDNCVGGANRGQCRKDLQDAIGALQYPEGNPSRLGATPAMVFEQTICDKSRDFQWLYSCMRENDGDKATAWSMSACAKADKLTWVQCNALVDEFRKGKACKAPPGGQWTPAAARTYKCAEACASALATALWECPSTFFNYVSSNFNRENKIALLILTIDNPLMVVSPRGKCSSVARGMIERGVESVKGNAYCGPKYDTCFADLGCRGLMRDAVAASFNPHAKRNFEASLCRAPYAFQSLYACIENDEHSRKVGDGTPWTGKECLIPDELTESQCQALLGGVQTQCTGVGLLAVDDAADYECSEGCSKSLVAVMSQCQTSLFVMAETKWTDRDRAVFRALVSREPPYGACTKTFGKLVTARLMQVETSTQCSAQYDKCVAPQNTWCTFNLREGVGASTTPEGKEYHESKLCDMSPDYQDLYQCVNTAGFGANDGWTTDKCSAREGYWVRIVWALAGLFLGGAVSYCVTRHRMKRGDKGGKYKSISEDEVRRAITMPNCCR
jgi:hypothetical protein